MKTFTKFTFVTCLVVLQAMAFAQFSKIAVSHNGATTFYTNLNSAVTSALDGDTIYLPGGSINTTGEVLIDKKLTIVGAGHYPDSTTATYQTYIVQSIRIATGADGGSLSGIKCGSIYFGSDASNQSVNPYIIQRCNIDNLILSNWGVSASQFLIKENVINGLVSPYSAGSIVFENNIFNQNTFYVFSAIYNNNIFYFIGGLNYSPFYFPPLSNSVLNNNIFVVTTSSYPYLGIVIGSQGCVFNNNIFCGNTSFFIGDWGNNLNNYNLSTLLSADTFINATTDVFSYSNDYHLKPGSPGINYGTDGHDVGLYGSDTPYKEGAVPFNPHIISKNIGSSLSNSGNISIDIKVSAQDR